MDIREFVNLNPSFPTDSTIDQLFALAWFWHTHEQKERFTFPDLKQTFASLALPTVPLTDAVATLLKATPPQLLTPVLNLYQLPLPIRIRLDEKYSHCKEHHQTIAVKKLLTDLLDGRLKPEQNVYLDETITCFQYGAPRAAIVMAWNLAYDHLTRYILDDQVRVATFNQHAKPPVTQQEDFASIRESLILQWCRAAHIIPKHLMQILDHGLTRRNMAAHPSGVMPSPSNVESYIDELVREVIHKMPLN